jgi:hypothetical protein
MSVNAVTPDILVPTLALSGNEEKILTLGIILFAAILFYGISAMRRIFETRAKEMTKREIAAYVAEGSISPEDATRMLRADSTEPEQKIASGVAWGTIKPEKAESLLRSMRGEAARPKA